jgi:hypothetical protein
MGKYIRHGIGALIGSLFGTITAWLAAQGIEVDVSQLSLAQTFFTDGLTLFVTIIGYALSEKYLKRFPRLDLQGWLDRIWLKQEAQVAESRGTNNYVPRV